MNTGVPPVPPAPGVPATAGPTLCGAALTLVHTGEAVTRSELTALLGVTRGTTGALAADLRDLGLIVVDDAPAGGHQQGRPSHRLRPDPAGPVALAAQVQADGFDVPLVGLGGARAARASADWPSPAGPER